MTIAVKNIKRKLALGHLEMQINLISILEKLEAPFYKKLAELLYPYISNIRLSTPSVYGGWGEKERLKIGANVILNNTLLNLNSGSISIGSNTFFGHNACVLTGTHDINKQGIERQQAIPKYGNDIRIGEDCWIASNVTILAPCTIENNVIIAAGAVVVGGAHLESNWIYGGVPAKKIKQI
jgi:acetyltransferase-like isoleucine patch superfamily enzyme